jgi:serine/threonine protein kinase
LDSPIASGGMADVWRGTDTHLGRTVAIKLLRDNFANDPVVAERFRREARALARLTHPNIVPVYDSVEEDGQVALIMRLIEGKSLRNLLDECGDDDRPGRLSAHLTVHIGRSIAAALEKAHRENIVHRDIKPANILIMQGGEVLLTDFGIAKPLRASDDDDTDLTRVDIMMGTAKYLSPEQVQGRNLDGRADMYSLGLVLYECLAGHPPFTGPNDQAIAVARLERDPTPLAGIRGDVPSSVISVIHRMLRRKPDNRYPSCHEVVVALEDALNQFHDAETPVKGLDPNTTRQSAPRTRPGLIDPLMGQKDPAPRAPTAEASTRQKDRTPRGIPRATHALPRAQQTSMRRNYAPVAVLLVGALIMALMLFKGLRNTSSDAATSVIDNIKVGHVTVTGMKSYDPNGDDGQENEAMIPALTDNNPVTTWSTVCYGDKYFGSKQGVGVVVNLSGVGIGQLKASFLTSPWNAEVYTSTSETAPAGIDDWGLRVADGYGTADGAATFDVKSPARNILFLFREIGPSTTCSNANPYKGVLSELTFTSAK